MQIAARGKMYYFTVCYGKKSMKNIDRTSLITLALTPPFSEIYTSVFPS